MTITTDDVRSAAIAAGLHELPAPGRGRTAERWAALATLARRRNPSLTRLVEADVDARGILEEAGIRIDPHAVHGVWASAGPCRAEIVDGDRVRLHGEKPFCSGVGIVTRALVTAVTDEVTLLVDVEVEDVASERSVWATGALADTRTSGVVFDGQAGSTVGGPDWYLTRPGFWHGAIGPAACWAGIAMGLVDAAGDRCGDDAHGRAHLGAMRSAEWILAAALRTAGDEIDAQPVDRRSAEWRARSIRHRVERLATEIADRFGRAAGPRPLVADAAVADRLADLHLYLRQDHAERDLEALGSLRGPLRPDG